MWLCSPAELKGEGARRSHRDGPDEPKAAQFDPGLVGKQSWGWEAMDLPITSIKAVVGTARSWAGKPSLRAAELLPSGFWGSVRQGTCLLGGHLPAPLPLTHLHQALSSLPGVCERPRLLSLRYCSAHRLSGKRQEQVVTRCLHGTRLLPVLQHKWTVPINTSQEGNRAEGWPYVRGRIMQLVLR